uniref:Gag-pol polyprotein n=1 Tax=Solanum tuberosum TaxID=4113 RepID=M1DT18_SOLTU
MCCLHGYVMQKRATCSPQSYDVAYEGYALPMGQYRCQKGLCDFLQTQGATDRVRPCLYEELSEVVLLGEMSRYKGYLMHRKCNPKERSPNEMVAGMRSRMSLFVAGLSRLSSRRTMQQC